jgi:sphingosine kinase
VLLSFVDYLQDTERRNHAQDICQDLPLDFDGVICLSGDGTIHEIFNGFAQHKYPMRAFRIPVAPIPTGSGNATSLNILGLKAGIIV